MGLCLGNFWVLFCTFSIYIIINLHVTSTSFIGMIKQAQDCLTIINLRHQYQDGSIEYNQIQQCMCECEVEWLKWKQKCILKTIKQTYTHTRVYMYAHTHRHRHIYRHRHTCTQTQTDRQTRTHIHICMYVHTYTHITCTHTYKTWIWENRQLCNIFRIAC